MGAAVCGAPLVPQAPNAIVATVASISRTRNRVRLRVTPPPPEPLLRFHDTPARAGPAEAKVNPARPVATGPGLRTRAASNPCILGEKVSQNVIKGEVLVLTLHLSTCSSRASPLTPCADEWLTLHRRAWLQLIKPVESAR